MRDTIRQLVVQHSGLAAEALARFKDDDADLYDLGMKSFAATQLMLALEDAFSIEFPDELLRPRTFASVEAMEAAVTGLLDGRAPALLSAGKRAAHAS